MANYNIREISEMFQLSLSTLRYYEEIGILTNISRTDSGQRVYSDCHVNRLRTICCFKNTGMSIAQLKEFFSYESSEIKHIDNILSLLNEHRESIIQQIYDLNNAYNHVLRKLHYYGDIKKSIETDQPHPHWKDYRNKNFL